MKDRSHAFAEDANFSPVFPGRALGDRSDLPRPERLRRVGPVYNPVVRPWAVFTDGGKEDAWPPFSLESRSWRCSGSTSLRRTTGSWDCAIRSPTPGIRSTFSSNDGMT